MPPPFDRTIRVSDEQRLSYAKQIVSLFAEIGRDYSASGSVSDFRIYGPPSVGAMRGLEGCVQAYYFLQPIGQSSDEVISLSAQLEACEATTFRVTGELMSGDLLSKMWQHAGGNGGEAIDPVLRVLPSFAPPGLRVPYDARAIKADLAKDIPVLQ